MKISVYKKIVLIFAGLIFSLIFLECGMRLGGYLILIRQRRANLTQMRDNKSCRVLCIGESTTQGQYPGFLSETLNRVKYKNKFSVIDEGMTGTNTSNILGYLPAMLKTYKPQVLVTMIGINDSGVSPSALFQKKKYYSSLRLYKLYQILRLHILGPELAPPVASLRPGKKTNKPAFTDYYKRPIDVRLDALKNLCFLPNEVDEVESELKKLLLEQPNEGRIYIELSGFYFDIKKYTEAKTMLQIGLKKGITNPYAVYSIIMTHGLPQEQIEDIIKKMLDKTPELKKESWPFMVLGRVYRTQEKLVLSEKTLLKALSLNQDDSELYLYLELSETLWKQKKLKETEDMLLEGISKYPESTRLQGMLGAFYLETGQTKLAEKYFEKTETVRMISFNLVTYFNYQRIIKMAADQNIIIFCMQYPMRSAVPLEKMVRSNSLNDNIFVVDNEKIFKDAVSKEGYDDLFCDRFSGDFGHCTEKGNRLIAENLARHILEKLGPDVLKNNNKPVLNKS